MSMDEKFLRYMATNSKTYATKEEFEKRLKIFGEADILIHERNEAIGSNTCQLGHNYFSTWSETEFNAMIANDAPAWSIDLAPEQGSTNIVIDFPFADQADDFVNGSTLEAVEKSGTPKEAVDWRVDGAVTPVQQQGTCASSWAISASGAIEAAH